MMVWPYLSNLKDPKYSSVDELNGGSFKKYIHIYIYIKLSNEKESTLIHIPTG